MAWFFACASTPATSRLKTNSSAIARRSSPRYDGDDVRATNRIMSAMVGPPSSSYLRDGKTLSAWQKSSW